ncbi:hypothetical protein L226DRAFT_617385 [Lentinus tigrinus ALCF2SS1-7]|uniref:Uncharacterized protein n=1 Tax=Lentinus tigrinus ALCF2SS1-6 TaxID=1328759 RepID=A0A5C2RSD5_9APHY|nr:hypothetical protein L227DRAFT_658239 [Lentinus tigrinus ALCF2SS1-6]RPD68670.1 hypothetical protein L226DRAFT_617385 [Lentinus tigrinus ALCF2SS1-7]
MANEVQTLVQAIHDQLKDLMETPSAHSNRYWKSLKRKEVNDVIKQLENLQQLVAAQEQERRLPSLEIPNFVAGLLANPRQTTVYSQARPYESQVDCAVLALLRHFCRIEDKILIHQQWTYDPEVEESILKKVADWSVQAVEGDTTQHFLNSTSEEDDMEEMGEEEEGMQNEYDEHNEQDEHDVHDEHDKQDEHDERMQSQGPHDSGFEQQDSEDEIEQNLNLDLDSSFEIVAMMKTPVRTPEPDTQPPMEVSMSGFDANTAITSTPVKAATVSGPSIDDNPGTAFAADNNRPSTVAFARADNDYDLSTTSAIDNDHPTTSSAVDNDHPTTASAVDIGTFEYPTDKSIVSEFKHLTVDALGRLVDKRPGRVAFKRPDFVVSHNKKPLLIIEDKLRGKTPGVRQLHTYLRDLGQDGTVGMCFSTHPRTGCLVVAMLRLELRGPTNGLALRWIGAKLDPEPQCTWYRASDKLVRQTLLDIAKRAIDSV